MESTIPTQQLGSVLVIGGCGFLGAHVVRKFLDVPSVKSVHVFSRDPTKSCLPTVEYHAGDIRDIDALRSLLAKIKPQIIVHLSYPGYTAKEHVLREVVIGGTQNVLQCAAENPAVEALIYTSTDSVVRKTGKELTEDDAEVWTESSKTYPYNKTKAIAETMVLKANGPSLLTLSLRVPAVFGEGHCRFVEITLERLRQGQQNIQIGDNTKLFNFVYVQNAAHAHVLAAKALFHGKDDTKAPKVDGEAFFISDDVQVPFWDLCRKIWAAAGDQTPPSQIRVLPFWLLMILAVCGEWAYFIFTLGQKEPELRAQNIEYMKNGCVFSIEKAKERLGYHPLVDQDEGIRRSVEWALEHAGERTAPHNKKGSK